MREREREERAIVCVRVRPSIFLFSYWPLLSDCMGIDVNITAFGRKLKLFLAPSRFSFKMSRFFAYFESDKMRSMRSALLSVKWNSDDSATYDKSRDKSRIKT